MIASEQVQRYRWILVAQFFRLIVTKNRLAFHQASKLSLENKKIGPHYYEGYARLYERSSGR